MTKPRPRNQVSRRPKGIDRPQPVRRESDLDEQVREFGQSLLSWVRGEPLLCLVAAASVGFTVGLLSTSQAAPGPESLPDYARKRA